MSHDAFLIAARTRISCASRQLAGASWQGASVLSDFALQMMTASIIGSMLLMVVACSMYVMAIALLRGDGVVR
ncbi:hypothetical protein PO002_12870 [Cupriavidus necator]|uniref:hypothetical protein n=1 Tax=Cupriavidus necator TaxID=106590 RepID=UPI0039C2941C